ncbi:MAG: hypothetical protein AAF597_09050, partial [Bacteroidota bacterium]
MSFLHGDLKWSLYPVLVGHFEHDGIVSAERAIDIYLGNILSERFQLGFYPGQIGEQEVIYAPAGSPKGTIVVGLGGKDQLTTSALASTVTKGVLKYAIFMRDNDVDPKSQPSNGLGVSTLFVGSNYGEIPLRESIRGIILGVQEANATIATFNRNRATGQLKPITQLEFVDYYEDRAYEAFKALVDLKSSGVYDNISLPDKPIPGFGRRSRFIHTGSRSWWQTFRATMMEDEQQDQQLEFSTYNRGSSYSREFVQSDLEMARFLAEELSTDSRWDEYNAKVLFELLIPNRYKDFIRAHRNIVLRVDEQSAAFPWELFHDPVTGSEPTFVRAGLIRQFLDPNAPVRTGFVRGRRCLVVANPRFDLGESEEEA